MKAVLVIFVITLLVGMVIAAWTLRAEIKRAIKIYSPRAKEWARTDGKDLASKAAETWRNRKR